MPSTYLGQCVPSVVLSLLFFLALSYFFHFVLLGVFDCFRPMLDIFLFVL